VLEIVLAALIFALKASTPLMRFFYSCSLITIKGLPNSSNAKLIITLKNLYNCLFKKIQE
jgi:hypothetical protein